MGTAPKVNDVFWKEFQYKDHSLSINASEAAVCAGFHEYKSVPELLFHHVYQGPGGQALLQHDACLLELQLVSEEEQLLEIAAQAGQATTEALSKVLEVQRGGVKLQTVEQAHEMRQSVVQQAKASRKLTKQQLAMLEEKTRYSVDTGCGHSWEDEALDQYERQYGWGVRRRNEECRVWHFEKCEVAGESDNSDLLSSKTMLHRMPSIRCVGPAIALERRKKRKLSNLSDSNSSDREESTPIDLTNDNRNTENTDTTPHQFSQVSNVSCESSSIPMAPSRHTSSIETPNFFLSIKGMVDGIRDEMVQSNMIDATEDDDSWVLRSVIVECKHRMRTLLPYPRFYECIQAVVYCQMYEADEADIIQVLRTGTVNTERKSMHAAINKLDEERVSPNVETESVSLSIQELSERKQSLTDYFEKLPTPSGETVQLVNREMDGTAVTEHSDPNKSKTDDQDVGRTGPTCTFAGQPTMDMKIAVSRISLDDHFHHLRNWRTVVLPRLREWAECVYRVRKSDELRYRLLTSMAKMQTVDDLRERKRHMQMAWELAFEQCPFLRQGYSHDSYKRELSNLNL
jgi:hypothetical protein